MKQYQLNPQISIQNHCDQNNLQQNHTNESMNMTQQSAFFSKNVYLKQNSGNIGEDENVCDITCNEAKLITLVPKIDLNIAPPNSAQCFTQVNSNNCTPSRRIDSTNRKLPITKSFAEQRYATNEDQCETPFSAQIMKDPTFYQGLIPPNSVNNKHYQNKHLLIGKDGLKYSRRNLVFIEQSQIGQLAQQNPFLFSSIAKIIIQGTQLKTIKVTQLVQQFADQLLNLYKNRKPTKLREKDYQLINDKSCIYQSSHDKSVNKLSLKFLKKLLQCLQDRVFMPTEKLVIWWGFFSNSFFYTFLFIYSILIFFAFENMNDMLVRWILICAAIFSIFDICFKLNTAFFKKDCIIYDRHTIIKRYIKKHFIFDVISMFVILSKIQDNFKQSQDDQILFIDMLGLIKIFSLLFSQSSFRQVINFKESTKYLLKLFDLVFDVILAAHILSICWYQLFKIEKYYGVEETWIDKYGISQYRGVNRYVFSLYWAVTTMTTGIYSKRIISSHFYLLKIVGYGDITPSNTQEALFATTTMIIMSCIFAYNINNVGMILREIQKSQNELNSQISIMTKYLSKKNVNIELISRVRHYLIFLSEEQKERNKELEDKVLGILSNRLKEEIDIDINQRILKQTILFSKYFSKKTINRLVKIMKEVVLTPNEIVFQENQIDDLSFYFIQSGQIEIFNCAGKNQISIKTLTNNDIFGEYSFFSGLARNEGAKSIGLSTLYKISREDFLQVLSKNDEDFQIFKQIQEKMIFLNNYKDLNLKCNSCDNIGHFAYECPKTHYKYNKPIICLKYNFSMNQKRISHQRREKNRLLNPLQMVGENEGLSKQLKEFNQHDNSDLFYMFNQSDVCTDTINNQDESFYNEQQSIQQNLKEDIEEEKQQGILQNTRVSSNHYSNSLLTENGIKSFNEPEKIHSAGLLSNFLDLRNIQKNINSLQILKTHEDVNMNEHKEPEKEEGIIDSKEINEKNDNNEGKHNKKKIVSILTKSSSIKKNFTATKKRLAERIVMLASQKDLNQVPNSNDQITLQQKINAEINNKRKSQVQKPQKYNIAIDKVGEETNENNISTTLNNLESEKGYRILASSQETQILPHFQTFTEFSQTQQQKTLNIANNQINSLVMDQLDRVRSFKKFFIHNNIEIVLQYLQENKKKKRTPNKKKSKKHTNSLQSDYYLYLKRKEQSENNQIDIKSSVSYGVGVSSQKEKKNPIRYDYY